MSQYMQQRRRVATTGDGNQHAGAGAQAALFTQDSLDGLDQGRRMGAGHESPELEFLAKLDRLPWAKVGVEMRAVWISVRADLTASVDVLTVLAGEPKSVPTCFEHQLWVHGVLHANYGKGCAG